MGSWGSYLLAEVHQWYIIPIIFGQFINEVLIFVTIFTNFCLPIFKRNRKLLHEPPAIHYNLTVRVLTFIDIKISSGKGGMATFTLNRLHSLCRTAHCRAFFGGFIQRAKLSTLESVRNNEQCKLEFLGGDNNGTK